MKPSRILLTVLAAVMCLTTVNASPLLSDYSHIRGFCHNMGRGDQETLETQFGYAKRLNLNSSRIWLSIAQYERNPEGYINQLVNYVRTAHKFGISVMPIFFNGNGQDPIQPEVLKPGFKERGDKYVQAIIKALKDEPGLLMWDMMNEPVCNDYYLQAPAEEKEKRFNEIYDFVRYYLKKTREWDSSNNPVTVGVMYPQFLDAVADLCDVLCFHDYRETRAIVQHGYDVAKEISARNGNKPLINSEMACTGRANPYDMAIEMCEKNGAGWYVFTLMISGYWGGVHGIFYPDGTIRDPSIVAAIMGFYRNRDLNTTINHNVNMEGYAQKALAKIEAVLTDGYKVFESRRASTLDILEAAEWAAVLLEGGELVPMFTPPTAKIETWRKMPEAEREKQADEIRDFAYGLAMELKKWCRIL
jgi:hypothetical protein